MAALNAAQAVSHGKKTLKSISPSYIRRYRQSSLDVPFILWTSWNFVSGLQPKPQYVKHPINHTHVLESFLNRGSRSGGICDDSNHAEHLGTALGVQEEERTDQDVVLLQEVWLAEDARLLMHSAAKAGLVHAMHFKSGKFGSGLVSMSRYPITESGFWRYAAAGDAMALGCGDFYAGKGVGWLRLSTPSGPLDVFNTHLHANYSHKFSSAETLRQASIALGKRSSCASDWKFRVPEDDFAAYRVSQIIELCQIIRLISRPESSPTAGLSIVLGGDLNSTPDQLEMALFHAMLPSLKDAWVFCHGDEAGYTCKAPGNTFPPKRQTKERIDYVMSSLVPIKCDIILKTTPDGFSYSDHFAVEAELELPTQLGGDAKVESSPAAAPTAPETSRKPALKLTAAPSSSATQSLLARTHALDGARMVLADGVHINTQHQMQRQALSVVLLLLGCVVLAPIALNIDWRDPYNGSVVPLYLAMTVAALLALAVDAGFAVVVFCMGAIGDATQANVLAQSLSQLKLMAAQTQNT